MHVRALADANIVTTADVCNALVINRSSKKLQHTDIVGEGFMPSLKKCPNR